MNRYPELKVVLHCGCGAIVETDWCPGKGDIKCPGCGLRFTGGELFKGYERAIKREVRKSAPRYRV